MSAADQESVRELLTASDRVEPVYIETLVEYVDGEIEAAALDWIHWLTAMDATKSAVVIRVREDEWLASYVDRDDRIRIEHVVDHASGAVDITEISNAAFEELVTEHDCELVPAATLPARVRRYATALSDDE